MKFTGSALFYYLATAGVVTGVAATSSIKDEVGAGGENVMSFKLSYGNADDSTCTTCDLCEGSALHNVLDVRNASLCVSCTEEESCEQAIVTTSFETAWRMTYTSLSSHVGDNTFDPENISIQASEDYEEGSNIGSWSTLASVSSASVYATRNESYDIVFNNNMLYNHYRFVFQRKNDSSEMKIGHVGVVESYLKTYAVDLFGRITNYEVKGLPAKSPTAAPTYPAGPEFTTNESLKTAVNEWIANKPDALQNYGDIKYWGTSKVTSMDYLFSQSYFNDDISSWNTASVTSMAGMFLNPKFNIDISSWNTASVYDMTEMFVYARSFNIDISSWNTASVTSMATMFMEASAFNADISSWNTAVVTSMHYMFNNANAFNQELCWDISSVTDYDAKYTTMFKGSSGMINCE